MPTAEPKFISKQVASELTGLSPVVLKNLRQSKKLEEGIHWHRPSPRSIVFDRELLIHWISSRHSPGVHEARIAAHLEALEASAASA